ncbi:nucleotidyl transferase AbiEii/AbiGii toxin family protein [Xanthomarina spongicola]|uniref:Putative nucleotidyltransferase component of viral defense system n=1 Tax=Xanthomarina spongicola TaxID=570520 RepID=A0A316DRB3_9FLAO|nr:nucleotidyl transferase AbiEii/AbiGii toxin family protein [Xanthomarina spongicola]PWK20018.1 putative nucleotidyltransferase component of viral defense system [Xanthomarina spongicola]
MIPRRYIEEWKEFAPWPENAQVEQDLVIERAIIEIFSDKFLNENLAFRGGTALHKLFLKPQARYSEDIDLVQIKEGPIKPILVKLREVLSFLGKVRTVKQNANNNTIVYRFNSEIPPVINLRLKVEINCREHFNVLGLQQVPFKVKNGWFSGECMINTYFLEELLGTKLRALYQRTKGRDLFDLDVALSNVEVDADKLMQCYKEYMAFSVGNPPTQKQYIANMEEKMLDDEFTNDIFTLLRPEIEYDNDKAFKNITEQLLEKI